MSLHTSVLVKESLSFLNLAPGMTVVDGTLGGGGHTRMLAEIVGPTGKVIAIDRFGISAPGDTVMKELSMTAEAVIEAVRS